MITLELSHIIAILSTCITAIIGVTSYFYTRHLKKEDEKRALKSKRDWEHKDKIFSRLDDLEIRTSLLELQHKHIEASGEWVKDKSKKIYVKE